MNTHWLRSFCTLVEVGHFTRTAERLNMTQSGVSQHVQKLEEQLGIDLLDRQGKNFTLTPAGERLYREALNILRALENLEQEIAKDPPYEGPVRLMSPGSIGLKLYPRLLDLQRKHPKLTIDYRFAPNADVESAIANSKVDIGFMTCVSSTADVTSQPLTTEPLLLVTPLDIDEPSWQVLTELGLIDHPDGSHHAGLLLAANYPEFRHSNLIPKKGFSNQINLILEPVSRGLGFTVLPAYAVEAFSQPKRIKVHQLVNPVNETLYLCTPRNRARAKRIETVIAVVRELLA